MTVYRVQCINYCGIVFDSSEFSSINRAKKWSKDRGFKYYVRIMISDNVIFYRMVEMNRFVKDPFNSYAQ
jgi:hypothetical protein